MFTIKHKAGAAVLTAAMATGGMLMGSPVASAAPTNCTYSMSNRDAIGTCKSGTGQFRIRLDCSNAPDRVSIWAKPGQYVSVHCLLGKPYGVSFETQ